MNEKKSTTMKTKKWIMMCITTLLVGCNATDQEQQIDELYTKMSQEERIAQLRSTYLDEFFDEQGRLDTVK